MYRGTILRDPKVQDLLKHYVIAELWIDKAPYAYENKELNKKYGNSSQPAYVLFSSKQKMIAELGGTIEDDSSLTKERQLTSDDFIKFLSKGLEAQKQEAN